MEPSELERSELRRWAFDHAMTLVHSQVIGLDRVPQFVEMATNLVDPQFVEEAK